MSERDDIATAMQQAMHRCAPSGAPGECFQPCGYAGEAVEYANSIFAALAAENYAVVAVPEGVAVAHGALLNRASAKGTAISVDEWDRPLFAIEATP